MREAGASFGADRPTIAARLRAAGCVFAEDEAELLLSEASTAAALEDMVQRRIAGLPLEQILGWAAFYGLRIAVRPGVFVPRRRTEFLAAQAIRSARRRPTPRVLDLCCGTGAIGAAVAAHLSPLQLFAADIEPAAAACARENLTGKGEVFEGDLFEPLPAVLRGGIDVLVANAPYVPSAAVASMPPEARLHEPRVTFDGGHDGLDLHRRIAAEATDWLAQGGHLLVECSESQAAGIVEIFSACGLVATISRDEEWDATVVTGTNAAR